MHEKVNVCVYRHESLCVRLPLAGMMIWLLGSDSHVAWPLLILTYLYCTMVLIGRLTVTGMGRALDVSGNVKSEEPDVRLQVGYFAEDMSSGLLLDQLFSCGTDPVR